jgi:hypothetical protein
MAKKRPWVTRKVQRKTHTKHKAWGKYSKFMKDNVPDDPDTQNTVNALRTDYVAKTKPTRKPCMTMKVSWLKMQKITARLSTSM